MNSEEAMPSELLLKVANFLEREPELKHSSYKEASARVEFIDSLIVALGWDVSNKAGRHAGVAIANSRPIKPQPIIPNLIFFFLDIFYNLN